MRQSSADVLPANPPTAVERRHIGC
jgi:hypothetical protein